jgi:hypothetical protein
MMIKVGKYSMDKSVMDLDRQSWKGSYIKFIESPLSGDEILMFHEMGFQIHKFLKTGPLF